MNSRCHNSQPEGDFYAVCGVWCGVFGNQVRRLLTRLIDKQLKDEIHASSHRAINGSCQIILRTFELEDFDKRLKTLEDKANEW